MGRIFYENKAFLIGRLESGFEFDYVEKKEKIYSSALLITRKSGIIDRVPITITEAQLCRIQFWPDLDTYKFRVEGFLVTNPNNPLIGNRYKLSVRVLEYSWEPINVSDVNRIEFTGEICSTPKFRDTPKGRKICDFMVYTENEDNTKSFIHSIAWEKYAYLVRNLKYGNRVTIVARIQSRKYKKYLENSRVEDREVYEASVLSVGL